MKFDKIIHNLSEKECKRFRKMLQIEELLGGSKGNVDELFFQFLLKNKFININHQHVSNTQLCIVLILCRE